MPQKMDDSCSDDDLTYYPTRSSYKPLLKDLLKKRQQEGEEKRKVAASPCKTEPVEKKFRLKDGGMLTITTWGKEINYLLQTADGRELMLEKTKTAMGLLVTDAGGNIVKSLCCEL